MELTFVLQKRLDPAQAARLEAALQRQRGVMDVLADPRHARVHVTFDPLVTGELALEQIIEQEGFPVAGEESEDGGPEGG